jgi:signal transduction histidine kinase
MALIPGSADADVVVVAELKALGDFIISRRDDITHHWVAAVDRSPQVESSRGLTFKQLLDHFPILCSELAEFLKAAGAGESRRQVSEDSASHGRHRWQQGYELEEVIREISIIRRDFLSRWLDAFEAERGRMHGATREAAKSLIRDFFEEIVVGSTVQFVEEHNHQVLELNRVITHEKQQAEQAAMARERFLGLISHELRTPLTPVLLDLANLARDPELPSRFLPSLVRMRHNLQIEAHLIDNLLDVTRIRGESLEIRRGEVDLHDLIRSAVAACDMNFKDKNLTMELQLDGRRSKASGDAGKLQRAFMALVMNASNVSEPGTHVYVRSRNPEEGNEIDISIEDTGPAFAPELVERVLDPFEEGRRSTFGSGGLGVGRYVAKAIIEAHDGSLSIEPGSAGGMSYMVKLPVH